MGTLLQQKLAKNIVKNLGRKKPLNKKELVVSSGYGEISAESSAHLIIEQKGVQEELEKYGFTEDNAKKVVAEILLNKTTEANARINAAKEIFKVEGSYAPEKKVNMNIDYNEKVRSKSKDLINSYLENK